MECIQSGGGGVWVTVDSAMLSHRVLALSLLVASRGSGELCGAVAEIRPLACKAHTQLFAQEFWGTA